MKLYERLPRGVTVNGHFYRMDFDFRNVLRMMDVLARKDLLPEAMDYLALKCVMRRPRGDLRALMNAARETLFGGRKIADENPQKLTDFTQDADLIRAAFWQTYMIDLWNAKLHWLMFSALLSGIPEGTRYSDIIGIRARPMPAPTNWNSEERAALAKAKARYAVEMTAEEQENSYQSGLRAMAAGLLAMAKGGGKGA